MSRQALCGRTALRVIGLLAVVGSAWAQTSVTEPLADQRKFALIPSISLSETYTNNFHPVAGNKQSELITELSPRLKLSSNSGRVKGSFDYSLRALAYAKNSDRNQFQNALSASGIAEVIENWAFLDVAGDVSQRAISAFGTRSVDSRLNHSNRSEVSSLRVSPYVRGRFFGVATYEARLTHAATDSDSTLASDSAATSGLVQVSGSGAALGWSAGVSRLVIDYSAGRQTEVDRFDGALSYSVNPQLVLTLRGGRESSNFSSLSKQDNETSGVGLTWTPSERTTFSAEQERRFFGDSHTVSFEHRRPRSAWTFSSSRDISSGFAGRSGGQLTDDLVRASGSIPIGGPVTSSFLTSVATVHRVQELSFALIGLRNTLTFSASRDRSHRLDDLANIDDGVIENFSETDVIRQRGFGLGLSHMLTRRSTLYVNFSRETTNGTMALQQTTLRSYYVNWSTKVGKRASFTLGARSSLFEGGSSPYNEAAVTASFNVRF